jgi:hypothetical protein
LPDLEIKTASPDSTGDLINSRKISPVKADFFQTDEHPFEIIEAGFGPGSLYYRF